jgi:hypothetical protein
MEVFYNNVCDFWIALFGRLCAPEVDCFIRSVGASKAVDVSKESYSTILISVPGSKFVKETTFVLFLASCVPRRSIDSFEIRHRK